jgi:hypothetical protein
MVKEKDSRITFRAPTTLRYVVKEFIIRDMYMNESDFYRDAAREKIKNDAPDLYKKLLKESTKPKGD